MIDAADAVTEGLRLANVTRARRPEATVVLVGEHAAERAPAGMRIYEKWDETEGVVAAIEDALERKRSARPPRRPAGNVTREGEPVDVAEGPRLTHDDRHPMTGRSARS